MKLRTRMLSTATAAVLLGTLVSGCTPTTQTPDATGTPLPSASPIVTAPVAANRPDYLPEDVLMETLGIARDTVLFTVDGVGVPAEEVLYWGTYKVDDFSQYTGGEMDWTMDMEGVTMKEYLLNNAVQTATLYQVMENRAEAMGFGFTAEDQTAYDTDLAAMKSSMAGQMGSDDPELAYLQWLTQIGLSPEGFAHINKASYYFSNLRDGVYGPEGTEPPTAESMTAWLEESGTLRAKHILINATASEDGSDDGMAAALEKANTVRAELKDGGDTEEVFDKLMTKYSEDVGADGSQNCGPEGYTFGPGKMVQEFYDGTKALAPGQVGEPVKSTYGYHIILRLDGDTEEGRTLYADEKANAMAVQWAEEAKVVHTADFVKADMEKHYTGMTALRGKIAAALTPEPTPAPTGTVAPTTAPTTAPTATPGT